MKKEDEGFLLDLRKKTERGCRQSRDSPLA